MLHKAFHGTTRMQKGTTLHVQDLTHVDPKERQGKTNQYPPVCSSSEIE